MKHSLDDLVMPCSCARLQGGSSALVVNSLALPGRVPDKLEIDVEGEVLPAQLAAEHGAKYSNNVHPVSTSGMLLNTDSVGLPADRVSALPDIVTAWALILLRRLTVQ